MIIIIIIIILLNFAECRLFLANLVYALVG